MTTLREKMKSDMQLMGLAESTQYSYITKLTRLYDYYHRSPAKLDDDALREYLHALKAQGYSSSTYNTHVYALRFFFV